MKLLFLILIAMTSPGFSLSGNMGRQGSSFYATGGTVSTIGRLKIHTLTNGEVFFYSGLKNNVYTLTAAGGGAGGLYAGGGAGGVIAGTVTLQGIANLFAVVGIGGEPTSCSLTCGGGNTTFNGVTATGGGRAGYYTSNACDNGGSGGGSSLNRPEICTGIAGQGFNGAQYISGGGGAGGPASNGDNANCNYAIGGIGKTWIDGNTYGRGGGCLTTPVAKTNGTGDGGDGSNTTAGRGAHGIVKVGYNFR